MDGTNEDGVMRTAVKVGIGLAAATAGTAAWAKVNYDDAVHSRNNDRNSLVNMALWIASPTAGIAGLAARRLAPPAAPWLFGAAGLMGINAYAGAATLETGWERGGVSYCNYGFCNQTAGDDHDTPTVYVGRPNPLGDDNVRVRAQH